MKNYLSFISSVKLSSKFVLRQLYSLASSDVRSATGSNLRNILMMTSLINVNDLHPNVMNNIKYHMIESTQMWRVGLISEVIDIKYGNLRNPNGWTDLDLDEILYISCTQ